MDGMDGMDGMDEMDPPSRLFASSRLRVISPGTTLPRCKNPPRAA